MGGGSELGSGSGSKDTNPDPAKWCGFFGYGSTALL